MSQSNLVLDDDFTLFGESRQMAGMSFTEEALSHSTYCNLVFTPFYVATVYVSSRNDCPCTCKMGSKNNLKLVETF